MEHTFILNEPDAGRRTLVVGPPRGGFTLLRAEHSVPLPPRPPGPCG